MIDDRLPGWARLALVAASIACAWATERWVERPFRHGRWVGMLPRRNLVMAGTLTLVVAAVSLGIGVTTANALRNGSTADNTAAEAQLDSILASLVPTSSAPPGSAAPGDSGAPAGSGGPAVSAPSASVDAMPGTTGGPVPADLRPTIGQARDDRPAALLGWLHGGRWRHG